MKLLRIFGLLASLTAICFLMSSAAAVRAGGKTPPPPALKTGTDAAAVPKPTTPATVNAPDSSGNCKLVLVTINVTDPSKPNYISGVTDCANIGFYPYLNAAVDQLVPYIMIVALVMITYSGFQYMMGGAAGDVKSARARITGILGGIIFFFLIRLILNQVAPGLNLNDTAPATNPSTNNTAPAAAKQPAAETQTN